MHVVIVGGGACGCFCAVNLKRRLPDADITVVEKSTRPMAKLAVTGGGRCNLTNSFRDVKSVGQVYPRGEKLMKRGLKVFSQEDTMRWFEAEGVRLTVQDDQCVFPVSQDAMEIVNTLLHLMRRLGVVLRTSTGVERIEHTDMGQFRLTVSSGEEITADRVVITVGGKPKYTGYDFLSPLGIGFVPPVPSLFTFNVDDERLHSLSGTVVNPATARLVSTKCSAFGPVLITHWGLSGPAVLKLSSHAANILADKDYHAEVGINWFGTASFADMLDILKKTQRENPHKQIANAKPLDNPHLTPITQNFWTYMVERAGLPPQKPWAEVGPRQLNRLASVLTDDIYRITGKGQFKDEFVTCGGISLSELDINTLECKKHPGLFFGGEIVNVDAVTGGFNLQAAWTMGHIIANNV